MKKLMFAMAVAVMAAGVQAASSQWKSEEEDPTIPGFDPTNPGGPTGGGQTNPFDPGQFVDPTNPSPWTPTGGDPTSPWTPTGGDPSFPSDPTGGDWAASLAWGGSGSHAGFAEGYTGQIAGGKAFFFIDGVNDAVYAEIAKAVADGKFSTVMDKAFRVSRISTDSGEFSDLTLQGPDYKDCEAFVVLLNDGTVTESVSGEVLTKLPDSYAFISDTLTIPEKGDLGTQIFFTLSKSTAAAGAWSVQITPKPLCEGGEIEKVDGEWVVKPEGNATEVTVTGLAEGETVAGVRIGDYVVPSGAFEGFGTGENANVFSLALNPRGKVTIDGKEIQVTPTIGKLDGEESEPFTVGEECVAVTVRAIPGLKYTLRRAGSLTAPVGEDADGTVWGVVDKPVVATEATVTLEDAEPPEGQAFYTIGVSVP